MTFPTSSSPASNSQPPQTASLLNTNDKRVYKPTKPTLRPGKAAMLDLDDVTDAFNHLRFQHPVHTNTSSQIERPPKRALTDDESSSKVTKN